jgi:hypothetical protein
MYTQLPAPRMLKTLSEVAVILILTSIVVKIAKVLYESA